MNVFELLAILTLLGFIVWVFRNIWKGRAFWLDSQEQSVGRSLGQTFLFIGLTLTFGGVSWFFMYLGRY